DGSREPERTLTRTRDGGFLGSPPYMSPEQIRDPRSVDARTDIWSLGVVAYRLLSAEFPFKGDSTGEILAAILERQPPRLSTLGLSVPLDVEHILARCLSRSREDRFPDAGALAVAMAPFASERWRAYGRHVSLIVERFPTRLAAPPKIATGPQLIDEPGTATVPPPSSSASKKAPSVPSF